MHLYLLERDAFMYITGDALEAGPFCVILALRKRCTTHAIAGGTDWQWWPSRTIQWSWIKVTPCMKPVNITVNQPVSSSFLVLSICAADRHLSCLRDAFLPSSAVLQTEAQHCCRFWTYLLNCRCLVPAARNFLNLLSSSLHFHSPLF